jgi:predicted aconitase with swiveling domain
MKLIGRSIYAGFAVGEALVTSMNISFFGGIDPETGVVVERGHELEGQCIAGKILIFPTGKGSTIGSYTLYRLKKAGKSPLAIINAECEPITAVGCIISGIPCVDKIPVTNFITGTQVTVDGEQGIVVLHTNSPDVKSPGDETYSHTH